MTIEEKVKVLDMLDKSIYYSVIRIGESTVSDLNKIHLSEKIQLSEHWQILVAQRGSDNRGSTVLQKLGVK